MSKKIWSAPVALVVVLTMALFFGGITVSADEVDSGNCGESVTWSLDSNGILTISGSGAVSDSQESPVPWSYYSYDIVEVVIEEGITSFGNQAFSGFPCLEKISLPSTLTSIGASAFSESGSLTTVTFASNSKLNAVPVSAFYGCTNLTTINLPDSVKSIGDEAFYGCKKLQISSIPSNTETIGYEAFSGCRAITTIDLDNGHLTTIDYSAFESCSNLESVTFPSTLTSIGSSAFSETGIKSLSLPSGITSIGNYAFSYCNGLTSLDLTINDSMNIGSGIFSDCYNLETVSITGNVTELSENMFSNCSSLETVALPDTITVIGKSAFAYCEGLADLPVSSNVKNINDMAFAGTAVTSVNISKDITYGEKVYLQCSKLSAVTIDNGITSIHDGMFTECLQLKSVAIPGTVTAIGNEAFKSSGLTAIEIPASVVTIGQNAFAACSSLASVTLNEGLVSIGNSAFDYCRALTSISIPSTVTSYGTRTFACTGLTSVTLTINETSGTIDYLFSGCSNLKTVVINGNMKAVVDGMFMECLKLTDLTLPATVTSIGSSAFAGCQSLSDFTIPSGVTSIGYRAFYETGLTSIVIPNNVTEVNDYTFSNCKKLKSVTLPNTITAIPEFMFDGCSSLTTFDIPSNIELIGYSAFGSSGLTYLSVPGTVKTIDDNAFYNCKSLTAVEIHEGVEVINDSAFSGCVIETLVLPATCENNMARNAFSGCKNLKTVYCTQNQKAVLEGSYPDANYIIITNSDSIPAHVAGHSITLAADIGVNFYIALPMEYNSSNTTVTFTWGDGIDAQTGKSYVHTDSAVLTPIYENGANYKVTCGVAARSMGDKIKMEVKSGSTALLTDEYSVIEYIKVIDKSGIFDTNLHRLVHSMVIYGAKSQYYFDYKTDNYVDQMYDQSYYDSLGDVVGNFYAGLYTVAAPETEDLTIKLIGNDNLGLKYYGASLLCSSQMKMRFYFEVTDVDAFHAISGTASFKGVSLKFVDRIVDGRELVYIETQGLNPGDLENIFEISIGGNTYRYDYRDYLRKVIENDQYYKFMYTAMAAYSFSHFAKAYQEALVKNG